MTVEFELWWLLILPLFFILGWFAARIDIKQLIAESTSLPATYFKGLHHLISNQNDKAIEAFTEAIYANADSLELHFALGSLYRKNGEMDRAINLHLNLLEKRELAPAQKRAVTAELAQDYLKAGLYDRAEELFKTFDDPRYKQPALNALLEIYVRERDWQQAIATATELERLSGISFRKDIAQYDCETAVQLMAENKAEAAKKALQGALNANGNCVRANMLLGDLAATANAPADAIAYWKRIETQNPQYLSLVAKKMLKNYQAMGQLDAGIAQLKDYLEAYQLPAILSVLYEVTLEKEGVSAATKIARNALIRNPSLQSLDQLLQTRAMAEDSNQQDIQLIQQTVRNAIANRASYYCHQCGFRAKQYHWQCPACNAWESLPAEPTEIKQA